MRKHFQSGKKPLVIALTVAVAIIAIAFALPMLAAVGEPDAVMTLSGPSNANLASAATTQVATVYSVAFNANGGAFPAGTVTGYTGVQAGKSLADYGYKLPASPTRAGHTFVGWNYKNDGTGSIYRIADAINANTTIYAVWQADYTMTYIAGAGGSFQNGSPQYETVPMDRLPSQIPTPIPNPGFVFKHWVDERGTVYSNIAAITQGEVSANKTYTALFEGDLNKLRNVTYRSMGGGTLVGTTAYANCLIGTPLSQSAPAPTPTPSAGFKFTGWTDVNGNPIDPATAVVGDNTTTINAYFGRLYTVSFVVNKTTIATKQMCIGELIGAAPDPTPFLATNQQFSSWSEPSGDYDNTQIQTVACTGDMVFTARLITSAHYGKPFGKR